MGIKPARKVAWLWGVALGCMFFSAATNHVAMSAEGEKLLIVNWDTATCGTRCSLTLGRRVVR